MSYQQFFDMLRLRKNKVSIAYSDDNNMSLQDHSNGESACDKSQRNLQEGGKTLIPASKTNQHNGDLIDKATTSTGDSNREITRFRSESKHNIPHEQDIGTTSCIISSKKDVRGEPCTMQIEQRRKDFTEIEMDEYLPEEQLSVDRNFSVEPQTVETSSDDSAESHGSSYISDESEKSSLYLNENHGESLDLPYENTLTLSDHGDVGLSQPTATGHLECYLQILNYFGISNYRRNEYTRQSKCSDILFEIIFWTFSSFASVHLIFLLKRETIMAYNEGNLVGCVRVGFAMLPFFTRASFVHLVALCDEQISLMLLQLRESLQFQADLNIGKFSILAICTAFGSFVFTGTTVVFSYSDIWDWSLQDAILTRSYEMSKNIFLWNASNYDNITDKLFETYYYGNFTTENIAMAMSTVPFEFCSILQGEVIKDIILLAPWMLMIGWKVFEKKILTHLLLHPNNVDSTELEICLRNYKALKCATTAVNDSLGLILKFVIMNDFMLFAYLFVELITNRHGDIRIFLTLIDVVKATVTYYVSLRLHRTNGNVKNWLRLLTSYKGPLDVIKILGMTVEAALDQLRDEPIGFGTEYFLINENFIVAFLTMVASLISMMVQTV